MASYISSNDNRFYVAPEAAYGQVSMLSARSRIPAVKLTTKQQLEKANRKDKTGTRTFPGDPSGLRRVTTFGLSTYLTGRRLHRFNANPDTSCFHFRAWSDPWTGNQRERGHTVRLGDKGRSYGRNQCAIFGNASVKYGRQAHRELSTGNKSSEFEHLRLLGSSGDGCTAHTLRGGNQWSAH